MEENTQTEQTTLNITTEEIPTNQVVANRSIKIKDIPTTETERQYIDELWKSCSECLTINMKLIEYDNNIKNISLKRENEDITAKTYSVELDKIKDKIAELFGISKKEISKNGQKLLTLYEELKTIEKNAFTIYKMLDSTKVNKLTFGFIYISLDRKKHYIEQTLDMYSDYFKPLYDKKVMQDYNITNHDFVSCSKLLYYYEYLARSLLFYRMRTQSDLHIYLRAVEIHKKDIEQLLANYTSKPYISYIF